MTISSDLTAIATAKAAIKAAIAAKGANMANVPFTSYASIIDTITSSNINYDTAWTRPTSWVALPDVTGLQMFVGLHAIYNDDAQFVALSATTSVGNYQVDWGDGTIEQFASGVQANHKYDYATYDTAGSTNINYKGATFKQAVVTVTPVSGNLVSLNLSLKHSQTGLNGYATGWLDIAVNGQYLTGLTMGAVSTNARHTLLEKFTLGAQHSLTSFSYLLANCYSLEKVDIKQSTLVTDFSYMFQNCYSIKSVMLFDTSAGTNFAFMFAGCRYLRTALLFDTASATNFSSLFQSCVNLTKALLFDTSKVIDFSSMFYGCNNLTEIPLFDTSSGVNFNSTFYGCSLIETIPLFNTSGSTSFQYTFQNCYSLKEVPLLNLSNCQNSQYMFAGCSNLKSVPLFDTSKNTSFYRMFDGCDSLESVPLFNTAVCTNFGYMFQSCQSLESVPLFNTAAGTNFTYMFSGCINLKSVPLLDTSKGASFTYMFNNCSSLQTVPLFNTAAGTNFTYMFANCFSLQSVPALNMTADTATTPLGMFGSCAQLAKVEVINTKLTISYASCKLSKAALEKIFDGLAPAAPSQTLTISGNWGADTAVSLTGTTTAGSTTVPVAGTAGLAVGMMVNGSGLPLTTAATVTFTDAGDLVNLTAHGLSNGDVVSFPTVVTTTGISAFTPYYVVNATANTFQVAATAGGAALPLTTNGTGTMKYATYITAINPNVSITLSRPATGNGTALLNFRKLDTSKALLKNWTVTG